TPAPATLANASHPCKNDLRVARSARSRTEGLALPLVLLVGELTARVARQQGLPGHVELGGAQPAEAPVEDDHGADGDPHEEDIEDDQPFRHAGRPPSAVAFKNITP